MKYFVMLSVVSISIAIIGFYNTYKLGKETEIKAQAQRSVGIVKKQRDIANSPDKSQSDILELMRNHKL